MTPNAVRSAFLDRLAAVVAPALPTRKSSRSGIAWRSDVAGVYHHVVVLPYVGDFEHPERQSLRSWTLSGPPIPRIHVNHYDFWVSQAQQRRWSGLARRQAGVGGPEDAWHSSRHVLELTVALDELLDFAPWVAAWIRAVEANDPALLLALPHPLEHPRTAEYLLATAYEWTARASEEYERRRHRYERA